MSFRRRSNLVVDFIYSIMISPNQSTYQRHAHKSNMRLQFNYIDIFHLVRAQTIQFSEHSSFLWLTKYTRILFNKRSLSLNKFSIWLKVHSLLTMLLFALDQTIWYDIRRIKMKSNFVLALGKSNRKTKKSTKQ